MVGSIGAWSKSVLGGSAAKVAATAALVAGVAAATPVARHELRSASTATRPPVAVRDTAVRTPDPRLAAVTRATPADSITAVFATQGQSPLNVAGTYTLSSTDSIHLSGQVSTPFGPQPVQLSGRFVLRHDTLSVSGRLTVTGAGERALSFVGTRSAP